MSFCTRIGSSSSGQFPSCSPAGIIISGAGNVYHLALKPLELVNETEDYGISMYQNRQNLLPILDKYIAVLQHIRQLLEKEDHEGLTDLLRDILLTRQEWLNKRKQGKWDQFLASSIPLKQDALKRFSEHSS
jgi:hypothetical protein